MTRLEELKNARTFTKSAKNILDRLPIDALQAADTTALTSASAALAVLKTYLDTTISSLEV